MDFHNLIFSTEELSEIVGGEVLTPGYTCTGIVTDSRQVSKGNCFLALRGERTDGHNYLIAAAERGASCLICEELPEGAVRGLPEGCGVILVPNTLYAFGALARYYRERVHPRVVAVTGSVGKTTTRQMIYAVLSADCEKTHATEGNFNNEIGLPITLMRMPVDTVRCVLEAGMNHAGELHRLSAICQPDVAVVTNIGTAHLEYLGTREGIRDAKLELLDGMHAGGIAVLNGDEPLLWEKKAEISARGITPLYIARNNPEAEFLISDTVLRADASTFTLTDCRTDTVYRDICVPIAGEHHVSNAAVSFVCGLLFGMKENEIRVGLSRFVSLRQTVSEHHGVTFIEDCYNASPESMEAELTVLRNMANHKGGRAVAVLGDILELGAFSEGLHRRVGAAAVTHNTDLLVTFGESALEIANGAVIAGMPEEKIRSFSDMNDVTSPAEYLASVLGCGDTVLWKASHGVHLERVMDAYLKYNKENNT